jgi:hypothetical protein
MRRRRHPSIAGTVTRDGYYTNRHLIAPDDGETPRTSRAKPQGTLRALPYSGYCRICGTELHQGEPGYWTKTAGIHCPHHAEERP